MKDEIELILIALEGVGVGTTKDRLIKTLKVIDKVRETKGGLSVIEMLKIKNETN